jgi:CRP-like cAMP-binding protein
MYSAVTAGPNARHNHLLAAFSESVFQRWSSELVWMEMPLGAVLHEPGETPPHVYFPTTAIASLLHVMENGAPAEIAIVGNEGMIGVSTFLGGGSMSSRALVQIGGEGFRMPAEVFKRESSRSIAVLRLMLRYTQALIAQIAQTAACYRHHSLEQRLCRWLLLSLDRIIDDELEMTQQLIADMLGVRRVVHREYARLL